MKKLTLVVLCVLVFIVPLEIAEAVSVSVETQAAEDENEEIESSGNILPDCVESGSSEEIQSGDSSSGSSCESGDGSAESEENLSESGESSSANIEESGDHDEDLQNAETFQAQNEETHFSDLIFLDSLEGPTSEIEVPSAFIIEETEISGHNASVEELIDDGEDF